MVIVHLSANSRRIISPDKNETLDQLFKRFCGEFGYCESEYEFHSYPEDNRVSLDLNINANRVKEVSLVQKRNSSKNSNDICPTVDRDPSPVIIENRKKTTVPVLAVIPPQEITVVEQGSDGNLPKKQPKRSAPKPPVITDKIIDNMDDSKVPDIDIPPPPEFMPQEEEASKERLYRSVECDTIENSSNMPPESSSNHNVREASDSYLHISETCNCADNVSGSENEEIGSNNKGDEISADLKVNYEANCSESASESSVEDVYMDEGLLGNDNCYETSEVKIRISENKNSDNDHDGDDDNEATSNTIDMNCQENSSNIKEREHCDPVSASETAQLNCPIAEMDEVDIANICSSDDESCNDDQIVCGVVENAERSVDVKEEINIDPLSISVTSNDQENTLEHEDLSSVHENSQNYENIETPKPKMREKPTHKSITASFDSNEELNLPRSQSNTLPEKTDISCEDGHPTDFPMVITEPTNPKYYWELPKQGKTMQFLSRTLNTLDISEPKVVKKIEQPEAPPIAPKPSKEVKVTVQESPSDNSGRPTYRPRQAKSLYFTAGKD